MVLIEGLRLTGRSAVMVLALALAGCGGGGGGGSGAATTLPDDGPGATPGGGPDGTPGNTPDGTPGNTPDGTPGSTPDGTPGNTPDGTPGDTPDGTPDDTTPDEPADDDDLSTVGPEQAPRRARAVIAENGPAIGIPGARLQDLNEVLVSPSGLVAFAGLYTLNSDSGSAVWNGPIGVPKLLVQTGSEIGGLPANVRFGAARDIDLASDGSIGIVADLSGASTATAYIENADAGLVAVLRGSDELVGELDGELTIESIDAADRSAAGAVIEATARDTRIRSLWRWDGETLEQVVKRNGFRRIPAPRLPESCRFDSNGNYGITDAGAIVFDARLFSDPFDRACDRNAIIRQVDGDFSEVVSEGDIVPGASASTFTSVSLQVVSPNGDLVVATTVGTPTGTGRGDSRLAYFLYPVEGQPRLIALAGEELQFGDSPEPLSGEARDYFFAYERERIVMRIATEERGAFAIVGGLPHIGQPHPNLPAPGASALSFVTATGGAAPDGFPDSSFFSELGSPSVALDGGYLFPGALTEATTGGETSTSIWLADASGGITDVVSVGEELRISGLDQPLAGVSASIGYRFGRTTVVRPTMTDVGDIVFVGSISSSPVLVQLLPGSP